MKNYFNRTVECLNEGKYLDAFLRVFVPLLMISMVYYVLKIIMHITLSLFMPTVFILIFVYLAVSE